MLLEDFIKGWRCRICKTALTVDNFGGLGYNHGIFCSDCIDGKEVEDWNNHFRKMYVLS